MIRTLSPAAEERALLGFVSERLALGMTVCLQLPLSHRDAPIPASARLPAAADPPCAPSSPSPCPPILPQGRTPPELPA
jgi:hypothetical protein